jgi:hypothetical protein
MLQELAQGEGPSGEGDVELEVSFGHESERARGEGRLG